MTDTAALDAWIAEHLLGWFAPETTDAGSGPWYRCRDADCFHMHAGQLSTTGDGMLMVLEAMQGREWQVMTHLFPYDSLRHAAVIPENASADTKDWVSADTLPLAVALAARAALEAEYSSPEEAS